MSDPTAPKTGRIAQIRQAYSLTRKADPAIAWILAACVLVPLLIGVAVGVAVKAPVLIGLLGFGVGLLIAAIVFGRRAERAAMKQIEGQPGAAAAILSTLRRGWTVTPGVAVNRNQDLVHRVVGRPGVILVGEGAPNRVAGLLTNEAKRTTRVVGPDIPVIEVSVGDGEGQVALRKINRWVLRQPRTLQPSQVTDLLNRLKAMASMQSPIGIPKGPLPKGTKIPRPKL